MKNNLQLDRKRRETVRFHVVFLVGMLFTMIGLVGCRQPVSNSNGGGSMLGFNKSPRLYGGTGQQQSYVGNQPVGGGYPGTLQSSQQYASMANDVQRLNQRLGAYDTDNQLLNTEVAGLKQKLELANQYNQTLKGQLADTAGRIQQSEMARQAAVNQLATVQGQLAQVSRQGSQGQLVGFGGSSVPTQFGGATIRPNNSLTQRLSGIQIPGGQARMDGDVIRVEFPSDRIFVPGSYQIQPAQLPVMQNIVATIRKDFSKQIVGIEAHWDNTPLIPATTSQQQLTATQALAVFDNLVQLGLPRNQMFTMAMASNRPRHPQGIINGVRPNRRIELVIYPETFDGS